MRLLDLMVWICWRGGSCRCVLVRDGHMRAWAQGCSQTSGECTSTETSALPKQLSFVPMFPCSHVHGTCGSSVGSTFGHAYADSTCGIIYCGGTSLHFWLWLFHLWHVITVIPLAMGIDCGRTSLMVLPIPLWLYFNSKNPLLVLIVPLVV